MLIQPNSIGQPKPSIIPIAIPVIPKIKGIMSNLLSIFTDSKFFSFKFSISKSPLELILEPQLLQNHAQKLKNKY